MAEPIFERWQLVREIGRGGAARVWEAHERDSGRVAALKVFDIAASDDTARRVRREVEALLALGPVDGLVAPIEVALASDGRLGIVMERMVGSAAERLRAEGPWSIDDVVTVGVEVARTLDRLHRAGIVHRDVKPSNLLVGADGRVALADFDIAAVVGVPSSTLTAGSLSPPHSPPERLRGEDAGPAGDVWSLGATLFTLLEGVAPFGTAEDPGGIAELTRRVERDPLPPSRRSDVPPALRAAIERAMAKDPADRFATAAAFADALEAVVPGANPRGEVIDTAADRRRWVPPVIVAVGSLGAVALAIRLALL